MRALVPLGEKSSESVPERVYDKSIHSHLQACMLFLSANLDISGLA